MMNTELLLEFVKFLNSGLLWLYFIIIVVIFYAIIALLTWNIKKPLMYLGIPTIIVGIFLIILRFTSSLVLPDKKLLVIFNPAVKPLFIMGIICIIIGIAMIVIYKLLNKKKKDKENLTEI